MDTFGKSDASLARLTLETVEAELFAAAAECERHPDDEPAHAILHDLQRLRQTLIEKQPGSPGSF